MAAEPVVFAHWHKLLEGLQASPMEFYGSLEAAVQRRILPEVEGSRVDFFEGGPLSAKREYLRVQRQRLVFDICGAPFGNSFFVSTWAGELKGSPWLLVGVLIGLLVLAWIAFKIGIVIGILFFLFGIPALLLLLARNPPDGLEGWDDPIMAIPFIGPIYQGIFRPVTRYKVDTIMAFQASVHAAVLEVVDQLTEAKGLRALSEAERQPMMREFFGR